MKIIAIYGAGAPIELKAKVQRDMTDYNPQEDAIKIYTFLTGSIPSQTYDRITAMMLRDVIKELEEE